MTIPELIQLYLVLLLVFAYVQGGLVGLLFYPWSPSRFWLFVLVGVIFALVAIFSPCMLRGLFKKEPRTRAG